jgi:ActR/RegA family two-component response regulator/tRNA A-37 threonylcarbamoyl transferase component Bud32
MGYANLNRALIIDDSADFRKLMSRIILKGWPEAEVIEFDPAEKDNDFSIKISQFDLIFLDFDLGLPDENGLTWLHRFSKLPNAPSIIMVTGKGDAGTEAQAIKLGASAYLSKRKLDVQHYINVINEILDFRQEVRNVPQIMELDAGIDIADKTILLSEDEVKRVYARNQDGEEYDKPNNMEPAELFDYIGYSDIRHVAKGGIAEVLLARDDEDGKEVIIKVIETTDNDEVRTLKRFVQEYTLISNLHHPHVIQIYERAFTRRYAYIVMEYFPGGDLIKKIKSGITPSDIISYLRQITEGLKAVHRLGIIHRDMKSANVLFRDDGTLAITDFGIAKSLSSVTDITANGEILGTPHYISPEQIEMRSSIDHRSDFYSLGAITYEMFTGKKPYPMSTLYAILEAHINNPVPTLPKNQDAYQPLIDKLMAKNPDERYQSADELLADLTQYE